MQDIEQAVARHYRHGALAEAIRGGLAALGRSAEGATPEDLAAIDEFHMGGHAATAAFTEGLAIAPGGEILDIGCGIGGAARHIARRYGCRVTGIDLSEEYVAVARLLTELVGPTDQVAFEVASATALPFEDGRFAAATLLHVGMNVADKAALAREAARVLVPGGTFGIYDVMRTGAQEPDYPVPWAGTPETSFLATPAEYRAAAESAGLVLAAEHERRGLALEFFARMRARMAEAGPPPLGLHILMGEQAPQKIANMVAALDDGRIAPVEMVFRRR